MTFAHCCYALHNSIVDGSLIFESEIVGEIVEQQSMAEFCQTKEASSAAWSTTAGVVFNMFYYQLITLNLGAHR